MIKHAPGEARITGVFTRRALLLDGRRRSLFVGTCWQFDYTTCRSEDGARYTTLAERATA